LSLPAEVALNNIVSGHEFIFTFAVLLPIQ